MAGRSQGIWYALIGVLAVVLLIVGGIALWPKGDETANPDPTPSVTPASSEPSATTPVEPSEPTTPEPPSSEEPTQPVPSETGDLPAPALETWDREGEVWGGDPPPVVFQPLFRDGHPGFLQTFGEYTLVENRAYETSAMIIATYGRSGGRDNWVMTVETSALAYGSKVDRFKDLHPREFAMCGQFVEGLPACMAAAEDAFVWVRYEGPADSKDYDEALALLRSTIEHYAKG